MKHVMILVNLSCQIFLLTIKISTQGGAPLLRLGNVGFILIAVKSAEFCFHIFCSFRVSIICLVQYFFLTIPALKRLLKFRSKIILVDYVNYTSCS